MLTLFTEYTTHNEYKLGMGIDILDFVVVLFLRIKYLENKAG
jgi:hypothetical protein